MTMDASVAVIVAFCYCIQEVLGSVPGEINLAFRKPASQSSTKSGSLGLASNAVDGNTESEFFKGSCSHTLERAGTHWWMVDLLGDYTIRSLRITNRDYIHYGWLRNVTIEVSRDNPFTLTGFPRRTTADVCLRIQDVYRGSSFPFECDAPVTGRYVRTVIERDDPQTRLTMCEFEVYENKIIIHYPVPETPNLALRKPARQSFHRINTPAHLAVDGVTNGDARQGSCSTIWIEEEDQGWWMVDLEDNYNIGIIRISNRFDCCAYLLANFVIEVSEKDPSTLEGFPGRTNASICVTVTDYVPVPVPVNYECTQPVTGRYLRIVSSMKGMSICEFEVYGPARMITAEPPKWFENDKHGQWVFVFVKSYGFQNTHSSISEQRYLTDCARQRLKDKANKVTVPFIQIDLPAGTCRFLENMADCKHSTSFKWTVYELVRI